jgi:DNA (cytosine-5)-methyltransferase 1
MKNDKLQEIIVDNFAGGGGASTGIEIAIGRSVDIAINHDPAAIKMHKVNHPTTEHYCESVWDVDPVEAVKGRKVGLAWFSPDCKHFSKAKGGKPVNKNIRGLAWVAVKWAAKVKPRIIILENVEEFKTWGPIKNGQPDPAKRGKIFESFKDSLKKLGYKVEHRELRASDFGAPTIRKRFFLIARCDGKDIEWPRSTHGDPDKIEVMKGLLKPWRTAGEIIDWNIQCKSIFDRKKPLSENTLRRIARGIEKFVVNNPKPFITMLGQTGGGDRLHDIEKPLSTIVSKAEHLLVVPTLIQMGYGDAEGKRVLDLEKPLGTITAGGNKFAVATAFITQQYKSSIGMSLEKPLGTVTSVNKNNLVMAFLMKYYGSDTGQSMDEPLHTVTTKDRFGLITIKGEDFQIIDIGMRMLEPSELFKAQGFPEDYIIDRDIDGNYYPKSAQIARCGNAVPPPFAEALVRANVAEICVEESITA